MKLSRIIVPFLLFCYTGQEVVAQETAITDLNSCDRLYYVNKDIIKALKKSPDSCFWFHNEELVIWYNSKKTKTLEPGTFYIMNHGPNKLLTFRIIKIDFEVIRDKHDKTDYSTNPGFLFTLFFQDSLPRCGRMIATLSLHTPFARKTEIRAMFVEISYFGQTYYKWFIKEATESAGKEINLLFKKLDTN
jgi:hypothetical protein